MAQTLVPREALALSKACRGPCLSVRGGVVMGTATMQGPSAALPSPSHQFPCLSGWHRVTFSRVARLSSPLARAFVASAHSTTWV